MHAAVDAVYPSRASSPACAAACRRPTINSIDAPFSCVRCVVTGRQSPETRARDAHLYTVRAIGQSSGEAAANIRRDRAQIPLAAPPQVFRPNHSSAHGAHRSGRAISLCRASYRTARVRSSSCSLVGWRAKRSPWNYASARRQCALTGRISFANSVFTARQRWWLR